MKRETMVMNTGDHIKADCPLIKDKHTGCLPQEDQVGGFPTNTLVEQDPLEKDILVEDPLMEQDPMEDILVEDHLGPQEEQGPPGPQGPAGPVRPIIVQTPQITLDTTALENTFDTVGQSMMQLARAQDQMNRQLQQHIQQGQVNLQAHTGALHQLANSTYQRNFDYIFVHICQHSYI